LRLKYFKLIYDSVCKTDLKKIDLFLNIREFNTPKDYSLPIIYFYNMSKSYGNFIGNFCTSSSITEPYTHFIGSPYSVKDFVLFLLEKQISFNDFYFEIKKDVHNSSLPSLSKLIENSAEVMAYLKNEEKYFDEETFTYKIEENQEFEDLIKLFVKEYVNMVTESILQDIKHDLVDEKFVDLVDVNTVMTYDPSIEFSYTYGDFVKENCLRCELVSFKGEMSDVKILSFHFKEDSKLPYFYIGTTLNIEHPYIDCTTPVDVSHFESMVTMFKMFSKITPFVPLNSSPKLFHLKQ
jgi:hypothetical protein